MEEKGKLAIHTQWRPNQINVTSFGVKKGCWVSVQTNEGKSLSNYGHAACLDKHKMIVIGGCNDYGNFLSSFFIFDSS